MTSEKSDSAEASYARDMKRIMSSAGWLSILILGAAPLLWLPGAVAIQNPTGQSESKPVIVQLFVSVNDGQGRPVTDMKREEFRVIEGSTPQQVTALRKAGEVPLTVGLMIDDSGSRKRQLPEGERDSAPRFFAEIIHQGGAMFAGVFNDDAYFEVKTTADLKPLQDWIKKGWPFSFRGSSAPGYAIIQSCTEMLSKRAGRRVLVISTDGIDNSSYQHRHRLQPAEIAKVLSEQQTILFVILLQARGDSADRGEREGGAKIFTSLAESTGGRALAVDSIPKFMEAFLQIAEEINNQYLIEFIPAPAPALGEPRHLRVETTRQGVHLRLPRRYVPTPP
jgi:VWFA-related protein